MFSYIVLFQVRLFFFFIRHFLYFYFLINLIIVKKNTAPIGADNVQLLIVWIAAIGFGLGLLWFASLNIKYVFQNVTTIESLERGMVLEVPSKETNDLPNNNVHEKRIDVSSSESGTILQTQPVSRYQHFLQKQEQNSLTNNVENANLSDKQREHSPVHSQRGSMIYRNIERPYDVGALENWKQVFGSKWILWFFPITTDFEGTEFPLRKDIGGIERERLLQ
jgi:hypothetical protein